MACPGRDYALTPHEDGLSFVFHRADCPEVRRLADLGVPVMTMIACEQEPDKFCKRHSCLTDK